MTPGGVRKKDAAAHVELAIRTLYSTLQGGGGKSKVLKAERKRLLEELGGELELQCSYCSKRCRLAAPAQRAGHRRGKKCIQAQQGEAARQRARQGEPPPLSAAAQARRRASVQPGRVASEAAFLHGACAVKQGGARSPLSAVS